MSMIIDNNEIHLIGNVENGIIDEHVITPFLTAIEMLEYTNPSYINLHLSGKGTTFHISHITDSIKTSKIPFDIYIRNSEIYGGWNGVDGELVSLLENARNVIDYKNVEYNPPFHLSIPEIQIMREYSLYKEDIQDDDNYYNDEE